MSKDDDNLTFLQRMRRLASILRSSETGPLIVAGDVVAMAARWHDFQADAGGLNACAACRKHLGHPLSWFERRHYAVQLFGRDVRNWMSHGLAVWLYGKAVDAGTGTHILSTDQVKSVKVALLHAFREKRSRGLPVNQDEAEPVVLGVIGRPTPRVVRCVECAKKEAEITSLKERLAQYEN
jgi:hypothetical protein